MENSAAVHIRQPTQCAMFCSRIWLWTLVASLEKVRFTMSTGTEYILGQQPTINGKFVDLKMCHIPHHQFIYTMYGCAALCLWQAKTASHISAYTARIDSITVTCGLVSNYSNSQTLTTSTLAWHQCPYTWHVNLDLLQLYITFRQIKCSHL